MSETQGEKNPEAELRDREESAVQSNGEKQPPHLELISESEDVTGPAVGIVAAGDNEAEVARVAMRALSKGHAVLLTTVDGWDSGVANMANLPGVHYIPLDVEGNEASREHVAIQRLAAAARALSFPGLIFVEDPTQRIDFERSSESSDDYIKRAIPAELSGDVETLVAIPAYNEAKTIASVVEDTQEFADEVLVVDDGSDDETADRAREAGATVTSHGRNRGYGAALQTAFEKAEVHGVDCLVIIDGDGQHDSSDVPVLAGKVADGDANVAIGSRFTGDAAGDVPPYRRFGIGVINLMSNFSMGAFTPRTWVSDTQSGFRAYDEHAIETLADASLGDDMDASLDILYHLHEEGFEIKETPIAVDYGVENGHSQNPVTHGVRLVSSILRTVERDHPVKFLGVPGVLMTIFGAGFGYATMANFLTTQTFPLGLALVSVFLILLGVFSGFTAIMLHSLNTHLDG